MTKKAAHYRPDKRRRSDEQDKDAKDAEREDRSIRRASKPDLFRAGGGFRIMRKRIGGT
jgi:hypothetical protein